MERLICLLIGYAHGLFQTAYFYGKTKGMDIRKEGSGNVGTTNTLRVMGPKAGAVVFTGDLLKTITACFIARFIFAGSRPELELVLVLWGGIGVILGHNYPFYLGFKGGKGIAATAGILVSIGSLPLLLSCLIVFLAAVFFTGYVSLGSLLVVTTFLLEWIWFTSAGMIQLAPEYQMESILLAAFITAMAFWRHRSNIKRLLAGTENKTSLKKN